MIDLIAHAPRVVNQEDRQFAGEKRGTNRQAIVEQAGEETAAIVGREALPQLAGQGHPPDQRDRGGRATRLRGEPRQVIAVEDHLVAVRVQMPLGQLDRLAQHDAQTQVGRARLGRHLDLKLPYCTKACAGKPGK